MEIASTNGMLLVGTYNWNMRTNWFLQWYISRKGHSEVRTEDKEIACFCLKLGAEIIGEVQNNRNWKCQRCSRQKIGSRKWKCEVRGEGCKDGWYTAWQSERKQNESSLIQLQLHLLILIPEHFTEFPLLPFCIPAEVAADARHNERREDG